MSQKDRSVPEFSAGTNIAMKVPAFEYAETVTFYRDILSLPLITTEEVSTVFEFGAMRLWIDRVEHLSQAEVWLEVLCSDAAEAEEYLAARGIQRCDAIEPLPNGLKGFWIVNPGNIVHLMRRP